MRRAVFLLIPWFILSAPSAGQSKMADRFVPLLDKLDPESDFIVLIDLAEAAKKFFAIQDDLEKIPLVAKNPALLQIWKMQRVILDGALASLKMSYGMDPIKDLGYAVMGGTLGVVPKVFIALSGEFPADFPKFMDPNARKVKVAGREVWEMSDGMGMAVIGKKMFLMTDMTEFPKAFTRYGSARQLRKRHPKLLAGVKKGLLLRMSVFIPESVRATQPERELGATIFRGLKHLEIDIGEGLRFRAETENDGATENMRYFAEGWKEIMLGGRNLMRAYVYFMLALDLQYLPDIPPPLVAVFENRQAILETMEQFLGEYPVPPRVIVRGREVILTAPTEAMVGNIVVIGTLAAVAIPAFITYLNKSKAAEAQANLMMIKQLEETYHQKYGKYLICGPVPGKNPTGDPVEWPGDPCFGALGFNPDKVYFSYEVALVGEGAYLIRAATDLDGDGVPMIYVLKQGDIEPQRVTAEDVW
jgi:hypothetical protein